MPPQRALPKETGAQVMASVADVSVGGSIEAWHRATAAALRRRGHAGDELGGPPAGAASGFDGTASRNAFELLVMSAVRTVRVVLPTWKRAAGSILMLTSSSVKNPIPNLGLSNVIRPAVSALVKTWPTSSPRKRSASINWCRAGSRPSG